MGQGFEMFETGLCSSSYHGHIESCVVPAFLVWPHKRPPKTGKCKGYVCVYTIFVVQHPVRQFWQGWQIFEGEEYAEDDVEQVHPDEPGQPCRYQAPDKTS